MSRVCFGDEQDRTTGVWYCPRGFDSYDCRECRESWLWNEDRRVEEREGE